MCQTLEWQILLVRCRSVRWRLGRALRLCPFPRCLLRVGALLFSLPCVHECDAIRIDGDLYVALTLPVRPLRCGDGTLHENEPSLGEIFSQADVVLPAAAYPYPCCDVLSLGVVINGDVHRHECSVCACDGLAVLADATDGVRVNHNSELYCGKLVGLAVTFIKMLWNTFPFFRECSRREEEEGSFGLLL